MSDADDKLPIEQRSKAHQQGRDAFDGTEYPTGPDSCPYAEGTPLYRAWMSGYICEYRRFYDE